MNFDISKLNQLREYYKDKRTTILGLNDSQGVNITTTFFKKGLLDYIADSLSGGDVDPTVINAFSLLINKTEHIDYMLQANLSVVEIKKAQVYSAVSALEKACADVSLPSILGKIGNLYKMVYGIKPNDDKTHISTSLRESEEPIIVYSSGVNNMMREVANNPFSIKKDYKERDIRPNYFYTLDKTNDPNTVKSVIDGIEKNFNTIYGINDKSDIYTLGAYTPAALKKEELKIFAEIIAEYNYNLIRLCKEYGVQYIETSIVGNDYNKDTNNFHISSTGHNILANNILDKMYDNKIVNGYVNKQSHDSSIIFGGGAGTMSSLIDNDYIMAVHRAANIAGYDKQVAISIANEHKRAIEVFDKVSGKSR